MKVTYTNPCIEADTLFIRDADKISFAKYCVQKIKQEFPNGLEAVPAKKRNKMLYDISFNYAYSSKNIGLKKWTPDYEKIVKKDLYYSPSLNSLNDKTKVFYCECYVNNLKKIYPMGVGQKVPKEVQLKIANICVGEIQKNIDNLKN
jgi:hypothetical protein